MTEQKHILIILDGYGIAEDPSVSAIDHASKPFLDSVFDGHPRAQLLTSGLAVGLPEGQMGNSEVGHMNLGAGRVVYQEITRINKAIEEGDFFENGVFAEAIDRVKEEGAKLHLMGLFSDGGVHSHIDHLVALVKLAKSRGLGSAQVYVHAFTDGRDTDPKAGIRYVRQFEREADEIGLGKIASIVGRYHAMDRDNRWDRTRKAYDLLTEGEGKVVSTPSQGLESSYDDGVTDEFVEPIRVGDEGGRIEDGDTVIFFNFRADRARQLTHAFVDDEFGGFEREKHPHVHLVTMTPYEEEELDLPVAFPKVNLTDTLGEVIQNTGRRQLRAAETEKYPHVTYFFSGGREEPFEGEDRILIPSPKVATYDLQPEMSAPEVAERVAEALADDYALVVLNFANPDMVGHTGDFEAAVKAVEAVDKAARRVVEAARKHGYSIQIIADHGNADKMRNPDGSPHTAHTTVPVPHVVIKEGFEGPIRDGKLGDVAPTILTLLGIEIPDAMEGEVLVDL